MKGRVKMIQLVGVLSKRQERYFLDDFVVEPTSLENDMALNTWENEGGRCPEGSVSLREGLLSFTDEREMEWNGLRLVRDLSGRIRFKNLNDSDSERMLRGIVGRKVTLALE